MRLRFRDAVNVSDEFADFLDLLLAPSPDDRPETAARALERLESPTETLPVLWSQTSDDLPRKYRTPSGTAISIERRPGYLEVTLPGRLASGLVELSFMGLALLLIGVFANNKVIGALTIVGGLSIFAATLALIKLQTRLVLTPEQFQLTYSVFGWSWTKTIPIVSFQGFELIKIQRSGRLALGIRGFPTVEVLGVEADHRFGRNFSRPELQWLADLFEPDRDAIEAKLLQE